jgi:DNA ligase-1
MDEIRPHLACDLDESKLKFPVIVQVKIDGVRGINLKGDITGRSLKAFKNKFVAECFSSECFRGVDGELVLGDWNRPGLCRETTGFVNRKTARDGKPTKSDDFFWYAFDFLHPTVIDKPYIDRLTALKTAHLNWYDGEEDTRVRLVPWKLVHTLEELYAFEDECLDAGFEGVIVRDPNGLHKSGRATTKLGAYLRIKRFIDFEGKVVGMTEAMENQNEAKTNELGRTERSTHQENMIPKGMVGNILLEALADVEYRGKVVIQKGQEIVVGAGCMPHEQRIAAWQAFAADDTESEDYIMGEIGKAKFMPHGQKDKLRMPTWLCLRAEEDMSD